MHGRLITALVAGAFFLTIFHLTAHEIELSAARLAGAGGMDAAIPQAQAEYYQHAVDHARSLRTSRSIAADASLAQRHKLRWVMMAVQEAVQRAAHAVAGARGGIYAGILYQTLWAVGGFLFVISAARNVLGAPPSSTMWMGLAAAYYAYLTLASVRDLEELFSFIETACIAAGIHFALARRIWPFIGATLVAALNRETGLMLALLYPLLCGRAPLWWLPAVAAPVLLLAVNVQLLGEAALWAPGTYVASEALPRPTIFNFWRFPLSRSLHILLQLFVLLGPFALFWRQSRQDAMAARLLAGAGAYAVMLLFGTYLGNSFPYMLLAPFLLLLGARRASTCDPASSRRGAAAEHARQPLES